MPARSVLRKPRSIHQPISSPAPSGQNHSMSTTLQTGFAPATGSCVQRRSVQEIARKQPYRPIGQGPGR
jgi:hypothetical protein